MWQAASAMVPQLKSLTPVRFSDHKGSAPRPRVEAIELLEQAPSVNDRVRCWPLAPLDANDRHFDAHALEWGRGKRVPNRADRPLAGSARPSRPGMTDPTANS